MSLNTNREQDILYTMSLFTQARSFSELADICKAWPDHVQQKLVEQFVHHLSGDQTLEQFFPNERPGLCTSPFRHIPTDLVGQIVSFLGKGSLPQLARVSTLFKLAVETAHRDMYVNIQIQSSHSQLALFASEMNEWIVGGAKGIDIDANLEWMAHHITAVGRCVLRSPISQKQEKFVETIVGPKTRSLNIEILSSACIPSQLSFFPNIIECTIFTRTFVEALDGLSNWILPPSCIELRLRVSSYTHREQRRYTFCPTTMNIVAPTKPGSSSLYTLNKLPHEPLSMTRSVSRDITGNLERNLNLIRSITIFSGVSYDVVHIEDLSALFWQFIHSCGNLERLDMNVDDYVFRRSIPRFGSSIRELHLTSGRSVPDAPWNLSERLKKVCPPVLFLDVVVRKGFEMVDYLKYMEEIRKLIEENRIGEVTLSFGVDQLWAVVHPELNLRAACDPGNTGRIRYALCALQQCSECRVNYRLLSNGSTYQANVLIHALALTN